MNRSKQGNITKIKKYISKLEKKIHKEKKKSTVDGQNVAEKENA